MEINIRIQKSLILDFDLESAKQSAKEDWKIDVERESIEKKDFKHGSKKENAKKKEKQLKDQQLNDEDDENAVQERDEENQEDFEDSKLNEDSVEGPEYIEYERLSEFFFDLCLSWCQHLDIETYIFFLNGIFLNITAGSHVNVSQFKDIDDIEVLSVEFFNKLLAYRNNFQQRQEGQDGGF